MQRSVTQASVRSRQSHGSRTGRPARHLPPAAFARASVRAVGTGYLLFAQAETGLFCTAFAASGQLRPGESDSRNFYSPLALRSLRLCGEGLLFWSIL